MKVKELKQILNEVDQELEVYMSYEGLSYPLKKHEVNVEEKMYFDSSKNFWFLNIGE